MPEQVGATPSLIACPACAGLGLRMTACTCRHNGNTFLTRGAGLLSSGEPYADCELCHGTGESTVMCFPCRQSGQLRAQGVLTVVNAVTGQTASVQVVPGAYDITPWSVKPSRRVIDLTPAVRSLAEQAGVQSLYDSLDQPLRDDDLAMPIFLPDEYRDGASPDERRDIERAAIAEWAGRRRWHLYVGYPAGVRERVDPERRLGELREAAAAAHLDLVIRMVESCWSVSYEVAGSAPRPGQAWYSGPLSLKDAVVHATPAELAEQMKSATMGGGHWVLARPVPADDTAQWTITDLEQRVRAAAVDVAGGSAVWRDGRWHISPLIVAEEREILTTQQTGQVRATTERVLDCAIPVAGSRTVGTPIPTQRCARCISGTAWQDCSCTYFGEAPSADCPRCAGAGRAPAPYCSGCDDTRLVHLGAVVTIIGPDGRGVTTNLAVGPSPQVTFFLNEHGTRCAKVPRELTAVAWAEQFGTDPDWLSTHGARTAGVLARDGVFATELADPRAVVAEYLARLTTGRPGARLVYFVRPPASTPVESLLRAVCGVDARLEISVAASQHGSLRWGATVAYRGAPSRYAPQELDLTLGDAVQRVVAALPQRIGAIEHDVSRTELLQPPQQLAIPDTEPGVEAMLRDLAGQYERVLAYMTRSGWSLHVWTQRQWTRIGAAPTLRETISNAHLG
ncbi:MAG: hypothetical protein QOD41_1946 [Cryptosporangiaceae bacterium]|nr:hypothetical protein [Cryptosporangiaceae bacterium]